MIIWLVAMAFSINVDDLTYALVEVLGKLCWMTAQCWGLEHGGSLDWVEEDATVLVHQFL